MPLSIHEIAVLAKEYARNYIKKGSTQLETNDYSEIHRLALESGILDLRSEVTSNVNSHTKEESLEVQIETVKKYSLGNCGEIARMALYYVVTHHPQVYAQVYSIGNGDHAFLIIGKKKPLLPMRLETWDEDAYVCDPWSNTVYPVSEWKEKLKDYKYSTTALSKETERIQKLKYQELKRSGVILEKPDFRQYFFVSQIYDKVGNNIGKTYFFNENTNNYTIPLNSNHFITPLEDYDSISQYQGGVLYRRAKIKSVIIFLRPFKDIFPNVERLYQLLNERYLLRDGSINEYLEPTELFRREEIINQSIHILKEFKVYLQDLDNESDLQKRCAVSIVEQIQEIDSAIACLAQLLEKRELQDIDRLDNTPIKDDQFSQAVKTILKNYQCPASKKMSVIGAIAYADADVNDFISYFYKVVKPALQVRRNPILDRVRGFFTSPVDVKGAKIVEQLENFINDYSSQLAKSHLKPSR